MILKVKKNNYLNQKKNLEIILINHKENFLQTNSNKKNYAENSQKNFK